MKTRRHAKILELISERDIDTQDELLRCLRESGFEVTQATVSRDIKELRLVKTNYSEGEYKYSVGQDHTKNVSSKFFSLFADSVLTVDSANNMVVIRCMTGMAQAICAAMDSIQWKGALGTVAGDDTIFVVCRDDASAKEMEEQLKKLMTR